MQQFTFDDFTGGVNEAVAPTDFSGRQWAELKGFIPVNNTTVESQWAIQSVGTAMNFAGVHPLQSYGRVYLVGIRTDGTIWWVEAAAADADYETSSDVSWQQITTVQNGNLSGYKIGVQPNVDYHFIADIEFEAGKYVTNGTTDEVWDDERASGQPREVTAGVLIGTSRDPESPHEVASANRWMLVAYVNPNSQSVQIASFPNKRRLPYEINTTARDTANLLPVPYGDEGTSALYEKVAKPGQDWTSWPADNQRFHPYTWLTSASTLLPGRGIIPRAMVGTMWNGALILGNIEWRSDKADIATTDMDTAVPFAYHKLTDGNTSAYRGSIYYSEDDIDKFDPRSAFRMSGSGAAICGLHVLGNTLIAVTGAGGESDGVIGLKGNLFQLHPYDANTQANPFAIRKEVIRGGLGVHAQGKTSYGPRRFSCLWEEAGLVVFIDRLGGVFFTDGESCDRLDRYGPTTPYATTEYDHVGAVGKHLFVWRNQRLWLLTITSSGPDGTMGGTWTELLTPDTPWDESALMSLAGAREEMYFVWNGQVYRYAMNAPLEERGTINGVPLTLTVSTATMGSPNEHDRKFWHKFGMTFECGGRKADDSLTEVTVLDVTVRSTGVLRKDLAARLSAGRAASKTWTLNRTFPENGNVFATGDFVVPAAIGAQSEASATVTFQGFVRLQTATFWTTGKESLA